MNPRQTNVFKVISQSEPLSWTDCDEILSDDDIALLLTRLDEMTERQKVRTRRESSTSFATNRIDIRDEALLA